MIVAFINYRCLLADLRKIEAVKVQISPNSGIRHVYVCDLSIAQLIHFAAVIFFPGTITPKKNSRHPPQPKLPRHLSLRVWSPPYIAMRLPHALPKTTYLRSSGARP